VTTREWSQLAGTPVAVAVPVAGDLRPEMRANDYADTRERRCCEISEECVDIPGGGVRVGVGVDHPEAVRLRDKRIERTTSATVLARAYAALGRIETQRSVPRHQGVDGAPTKESFDVNFDEHSARVDPRVRPLDAAIHDHN